MNNGVPTVNLNRRKIFFMRNQIKSDQGFYVGQFFYRLYLLQPPPPFFWISQLVYTNMVYNYNYTKMVT